MSTPSGICPACGRSIRLKVNGSIFHHGAERVFSATKGWHRPDCNGTNQLPKPKDDNDDD